MIVPLPNFTDYFSFSMHLGSLYNTFVCDIEDNIFSSRTTPSCSVLTKPNLRFKVSTSERFRECALQVPIALHSDSAKFTLAEAALA